MLQLQDGTLFGLGAGSVNHDATKVHAVVGEQAGTPARAAAISSAPRPRRPAATTSWSSWSRLRVEEEDSWLGQLQLWSGGHLCGELGSDGGIGGTSTAVCGGSSDLGDVIVEKRR